MVILIVNSRYRGRVNGKEISYEPGQIEVDEATARFLLADSPGVFVEKMPVAVAPDAVKDAAAPKDKQAKGYRRK